jgi:hypothetical protein
LSDAYAKAIQYFDDAAKASSNAWKLIDAEKVNWLEAYKKDYADILSIFEGDKRVTDSFFKQPPRGKKGKQPPETKA